MKAIQSVVYALFKVNIFANASAKSYSSMAGSASKAKKETQQLAGIHDELNNIQNNDDSDSGSESDGGVAPNFDLSNVNSQMSSVAQKIYDFFKPLKDSWDMYGQTVIEAFKSAFDGIGLTVSVMWSSVESIFTNGTIFSIIANILNSIGEIGNAWANAWTNDNNGTEIIQGIVNIINDLTNAILNLVSSTGFQSFLNGIISAFTGIVQFLEPVVSGFIEMSGIIIEIVMSTIGDLLTLIGDTLQAIGQNETAVTILRAVGEAIAIIVAGIIAWNVAQLVLNGLMGLFALLTSPITWIVIAITAIIAIIVLCIQHWNEICEVVSNVVNAIVEFIQELWNNVSFIFEAIWEVISTILGFIWNMFMTVFEAIWNIVSPILNAIWQIISTIFQAIWNIISSILGSIWNVFSQVFNWIWELTSKIFQGIWNVISPIITAIWEGIKTALSGIQQVWSTIWNTVSNVVRNVWNGIWSCIKGVINTILGGIEGFVNGVIKGINFLLSGISSIANAVGSLIGLSPINLKINTISLPRLAKGGVLTKATAVIAGEYSGASTNPEIVTPQNIMEETFDKVMSRYQGNNNEKPIYLTVNVSNKKLGHILLDDLRDMKRQTGNGLEALVGG